MYVMSRLLIQIVTEMISIKIQIVH